MLEKPVIQGHARRTLRGPTISIVAAVLLGACETGSPAAPPDAMDVVRSDAVDASTTDAMANDSADAAADSWSVAPGCNPLATTSECMLPYPSDFLTVADPTTATGLRYALPPNSLQVPSSSAPIDMTPYNRIDGAPTSVPILVHFGVEIASTFLANDTQTAMSVTPASPIALFNAATGDRVPFLSEMDANSPGRTTRHVLIIRPLIPLAFGTRYIVAIQNTVQTTTGGPVPESPGFSALRDGAPTNIPQIEAARSRYEDIFTFLASNGYARNTLLLACWDYTTASYDYVIGPIVAMRQQVFTAAAAGQIGYTVDSVTASTYQPGATIVEGTFTPPNYLQANNTIQWNADPGRPSCRTQIPAPSVSCRTP